MRDPELNGLYQLLDGFYREDPNKVYFDHINLTIQERNPVVEIVENILRNHEVDPRFEKLEERGNIHDY